MASEMRIPEGFWSFMGLCLGSFGLITEDELMRTLVKPRLNCSILKAEEYRFFQNSEEFFVSNHPENVNRKFEDVRKKAPAMLIDVKADLKKFPENEKGFIEYGFIEFDYVILISKELSEQYFRIDQNVSVLNSVYEYRLFLVIHELIHAYEHKLGKFILDAQNTYKLPLQILQTYKVCSSVEKMT